MKIRGKLEKGMKRNSWQSNLHLYNIESFLKLFCPQKCQWSEMIKRPQKQRSIERKHQSKNSGPKQILFLTRHG